MVQTTYSAAPIFKDTYPKKKKKPRRKRAKAKSK